jgi:hypothetical protein
MTTIEANFDTYTPLPISSTSQPYSTSSGSGEVALGQYNWTLFATPAVPNLIYGYWIDYEYPPGGGRVVATWESFQTSDPMNASGNYVTLGIPLDTPSPSSAVQY